MEAPVKEPDKVELLAVCEVLPEELISDFRAQLHQFQLHFLRLLKQFFVSVHELSDFTPDTLPKLEHARHACLDSVHSGFVRSLNSHN